MPIEDSPHGFNNSNKHSRLSRLARLSSIDSMNYGISRTELSQSQSVDNTKITINDSDNDKESIDKDTSDKDSNDKDSNLNIIDKNLNSSVTFNSKPFPSRKVKYFVIDEAGIKTENEIELKTPEDLHKIPSKYLTAQERVYLKESRWTPSRVLMAHLEEKINNTVGRYWWKKYISAAFWSNIATPINLAITLFTTLTTGQAATDSLLSQDVFVRISIISLVLSTLNTFFRPHQQMNINMDAMNKWRQIGSRFEEIYYSECFNDLDYERRIKGYQDIQKDVHNEQIAQETVIQNYLTDLIYFIVSRSCLSKSEWITDKHKTINSNNPVNSKQNNQKDKPKDQPKDQPKDDNGDSKCNDAEKDNEKGDKKGDLVENNVDNYKKQIDELTMKNENLQKQCKTYEQLISSGTIINIDNIDNIDSINSIGNNSREDDQDTYLDNPTFKSYIMRKLNII